jgi:hypothetical protein
VDANSREEQESFFEKRRGEGGADGESRQRRLGGDRKTGR